MKGLLPVSILISAAMSSHLLDVTVLAVETTSDHTDIACFESYAARCKLTSEQRFHILTNHYTPPPNFQFSGRVETCGCQRHFQASWLLRYSWLEYSVQAKGGFCVPCILFGVGPDGVNLGVCQQMTHKLQEGPGRAEGP